MNKFIALTKLQLKDFISRYQSGLNVKRGNLGKILLFIVAALLFFPSVQIAKSLYAPLALMGYPELLISMMYMGTIMIMLFTALPFILSIFFYSKDIAFLSSLPITESTIVFSKLSTIYIYLLGISGFVFGPSLVIFVSNSNQGMLLFFPALLAFILSPILPLVIATIVILPLMRFVGGSKRRNLFSIVGNILLFVIIIAMQLAVTRVQTDPEATQQLLTQSDGVLSLFGKGFPPSIWVTKMIQGSIGDTFLFIGTNLLLIFALYLLSKLVYRKAMLSYNQAGSGNIKQGSIYYKKRSIGYQLVKRHLYIIISTPAFFLNTFVTMFVPVLVFTIMIFTGEASLQVLQSPMLDPYKVYIFAGVISSPAIMGSTSATSITREGKSFWETKILPITIQENIRYRVVTTIIISLLGSFLLGIASLFFIKLSWMELVLGILVGVILTLFLATIDLIINIYRPLLDWTNPTAAVKNNLNVTISLALRVVVGGFVYAIYLLGKDFGVNTIILLCSAVFFLLYIIARHLLYKVFSKKFKDISI